MPATCKVVGLWLCCFAMIDFLCCRLRERILCFIPRSKRTFFYVVLSNRKAANDGNNLHKEASTNHCNMLTVGCKKRQWGKAYFSWRIAMSKQWRLYIFYVILRGSKWQYNNTNIARSKELRYDKEMQQSNFYCCWLQEATSMGISLLYCKGSDENDFFDVARSGCIASVHATTISQPLKDTRMQQSNNTYAVGCKDDSNKQCWLQGWRQWAHLSYRRKQWQWWLIAAKERKIAPCNN